ncbi:MAG TPA: HEPN domain-containing protein [Desulfuromonadales bacterium]|nr:HEPN domain-containing protein [Desulfuromonadales bacterium]
MTDRETIFLYRMKQTEETLAEAVKMLESGFSPRSIVNRSYYAMFYAVLALFIHYNTPHKTSKHSGVIGIFNKEFIYTGKLEPRFAKMLYDLFDERMELDYRDFAETSEEDSRNAVSSAQEFVTAIKILTGQ